MERFSSKIIVLGFGTVFVLAIAFSVCAQESDAVWVWNEKCPNPTMIMVRVQLDGATVFRKSISVCRWGRNFEDGKASFTFVPHRPMVWYGYRSDPGNGTKDLGDKIPANTPFEIDLWQAGGESDVIELGYSAIARDGIHMNSIHLLWPTKLSKSILAPGLILETWPEGNSVHNPTK